MKYLDEYRDAEVAPVSLAGRSPEPRPAPG